MGVLSPDITNILNSLYIDTLKDTDRIKEDVPEKKNLYLSAFFGLIRNGHKYEVVEDKPKPKKPVEPDPKKKKKNKKMDEFFDDNPTEKDEVTKTLVMIIDGKGYRCPEVDLQYAFGDMYETVTGQVKKGLKDPYHNHKSDEVFLPDVYADTDMKETGKEEESVQKDLTPAIASSRTKKPVLPYLGINSAYENDDKDVKGYDSFLFNTHMSSVKMKDGQTFKYQFVVYPLLPDMTDCMSTDILVISQDEDERVRTVMSDTRDGHQKSVTVEYDDITFIVRAHWEDGAFVSTVAVLSAKHNEHPIFNDRVIPTIPSHQTSTFYLRHVAKNGNVLDVFPLSLIRNDPKTGVAPVVFMVEDGQSRQLFTSGDNTSVSIYLAGQEIQTFAFWSGNLLQLSIEIENQ